MIPINDDMAVVVPNQSGYQVVIRLLLDLSRGPVDSLLLHGLSSKFSTGAFLETTCTQLWPLFVMGVCRHVIITVDPNKLSGTGMKWSLHARYVCPGNTNKEQGKQH